jgi:orotidine 5'-phosphate decarboxylase subfamily 2
MDFKHKLAKSRKRSNSLLCVGLDPDLAKMPKKVASSSEPLFEFNKAIIDATADLVCVYKPNSAFYEATGSKGIEQLKKTCAYIKSHYPEVPILLDFKRGDIGNTNNYYAQFSLYWLGHPILVQVNFKISKLRVGRFMKS